MGGGRQRRSGANVHERHQRIALELVTDLNQTTKYHIEHETVKISGKFMTASSKLDLTRANRVWKAAVEAP